MGGLKLLRLRMLPMCFHVMGSSPSGPAAATTKPSSSRCVKLIRTDGRVDVYHRPVRASEVMTEHPKHLVCRSDAFTIGQRIPALSEDEHLKPGHAYFLLPVHLFQSVLSFVTLASSFASCAASKGVAVGGCPSASSAPLLLRPFDLHKTSSGKLQIRISDEFIQRVQDAQEGKQVGVVGRVCTTASLEKDYRQLVVGWKERQWKPKLETIRESSSERRKGILLALRGIRRRRKKGHLQVDPQGQDQKPPSQKKQKKLEKQLQKQKKQEKQLQKQLKKKHKHKARQIDSQDHDQKQQQQQQPQQKKQKHEAQQIDSQGHDQKQELQQKPQKKKEKKKACSSSKHPNSPSSNKSKGKKVAAIR
uniref:Uncharacterized protein n=1 Tax=Anthurium amnicola TaxID=1678845 RepID=A0A1D1YIZ2_9ARAE